VTDADLILGYLDARYFLGGRMALDVAAAERAIQERLAEPLGLDVARAAWTVHQVVNENMANATRVHTVERGRDARAFPLFAFGGAGPVHASRYAAELGIRQVVIPLTASVHGATGLISSDLVYEYGKSDHVVIPVKIDHVNDNFSMLLAKALNDLRAAGFSESEIQVMRSVDMRYRYQVHELNVPFAAGMSAITEQDMEDLYGRFDDLYEKAFGHGSGYREAGKTRSNTLLRRD